MSILSLHVLCSCRRAQYESDALSTHFSSPLEQCAAFGEVCDLVAPPGCTVDDKAKSENEQFLPVVDLRALISDL